MHSIHIYVYIYIYIVCSELRLVAPVPSVVDCEGPVCICVEREI